jgi:hypothetical protein
MRDQQGRVVCMIIDTGHLISSRKSCHFFNAGISNVSIGNNHRSKKIGWNFFMLQGDDRLCNYINKLAISRGRFVGREILRCKEKTFFAHRYIKT